jgi:hypothetical protein
MVGQLDAEARENSPSLEGLNSSSPPTGKSARSARGWRQLRSPQPASREQLLALIRQLRTALEAGLHPPP